MGKLRVDSQKKFQPVLCHQLKSKYRGSNLIEILGMVNLQDLTSASKNIRKSIKNNNNTSRHGTSLSLTGIITIRPILRRAS